VESENKKLDAEITFQFEGVVSRTRLNSEVYFCAWYQQPDFKAAKTAGIAHFRDFCKDFKFNTFVCSKVQGN
jgi:hypothetical protein